MHKCLFQICLAWTAVVPHIEQEGASEKPPEHLHGDGIKHDADDLLDLASRELSVQEP